MRAALLLLASALFLAIAPGAGAGPLEPTAASQLVQLRTFGTDCNESGGHRLDVRTHGDGTTEFPYSLPPKRVLIVRSVRFDATPGAGVGVIVSLQVGGNLIAVSAGTGSTVAGLENGHYQGVFEFDPGLEVRDVSGFCVTTQNGGKPFASAVGFLAKAK